LLLLLFLFMLLYSVYHFALIDVFSIDLYLFLRLVYLLFQSFFLYSVVVSHSFVQVLPFELRKISDIPDII